MAPTPAATYRLQLGPDLTLDDARGLLPYLERLGVDTLYLSPIVASAGGGGYHVVDPTRVDPDLGGEAAFDALAGEARGRGMGILLDIVPNHMKASEDSPWWSDVLRRGPGSRFAHFFDIDWDAGGGKVVLPVLTEPGAREEDEHTIRVHWREGLPDINYRRFFDITDLVCLRQEDPAVFEATHDLVVRLAREGKVTGLRVDHVDGLRDPQSYLERLREASGVGYLIVEKILAPGEELPEAWPVDGTTGYEVAAALGAMLTDPEGAAACDEIAARAGAGGQAFADVSREARREVMAELFPGEVSRLAGRLTRLAAEAGGSLEPATVLRALVEATAALPVYRTYVRGGPVSARDRRVIEGAIRAARRGQDAATARALRFLRRVLLLEDRPAPPGWLDAVLDWQQLTGPVMAKGVEDTALYRHAGLVSRNEVGATPEEGAASPGELHEFLTRRAGSSPRSLNATSTHDSKRGEDVRARVAVLSEVPDAWERRLGAWREIAASLPIRPAPSPEDRLLLFQTMLGAWPLAGEPDEAFVSRIQTAGVKAAREAKTRTSWLDPDEPYEEGLRLLVAELLRHPDFLPSFVPFEERLTVHGAVNALAQLVLKLVAPGVPDLYQGAELWHLRLVDPDNRAPVDFALRDRMLDELASRSDDLPDLADELLREWRDGRLKLHVTSGGLALRRRLPEVFRHGRVEALGTWGDRGEHAVAFLRHLGDAWVVAVAPRLSTRVAGVGRWPLGDAWGNTIVAVPAEAPTSWTNVFTDETVAVERPPGEGPLLRASDVLRRLPVALLAGATA